MNHYENIVIIDADVGQDDKKALMERLEEQMNRRNGVLIELDDWGTRKLAYEIGKKRQGQYVRIDFCGNGEVVSAMERTLVHDQRVLRFMTIRLEENVDAESLKAAKEPQQAAAQNPAETDTSEAEATQPPQAAAAPEAQAEPAAEEKE